MNSSVSPAVSITDIERQIAFETTAVQRGIARYRSNVATSGIGDLRPGRVIIDEILCDLKPAIEELQAKARASLAGKGRGHRPGWLGPVNQMDAEKMAFITIRTMLTGRQLDGLIGSSLTGAALATANAIISEIELSDWLEDAAAKATETGEKNLPKMIVMKSGGGTARMFQSWRTRFDVPRQSWTQGAKLQLGVLLINLAVIHGQGWYEIKIVASAGKTHRRLCLTDAGEAAVTDMNAEDEINRPFLMPMLCPPKPWIRATEMTE